MLQVMYGVPSSLHPGIARSIMNKITVAPYLSLLFLVLANPAKGMAAENLKTMSVPEESLSFRRSTMTGTITWLDNVVYGITMDDDEGREHVLAVDTHIGLGEFYEGDKVSIGFYQSSVIEIREPTSEEREIPLAVIDGIVDAPEGTLPAAGGLVVIKALVRILDVDGANKTIMVEAPNGNEFTLFAGTPLDIASIKKGTEAMVTFTEEFAISLEKANPMS